jgi:hypothetical protein
VLSGPKDQEAYGSHISEPTLDHNSQHTTGSQPPCNPGGPDDSEPEAKASVFTEPCWTLFFDGSSCKQGARAGVLLLTPDGEQFKYMVHLDFKATNNMVYYQALGFGLSITLSLWVRQLLVKGDSQLIIKQVKGECSCNDL